MPLRALPFREVRRRLEAAGFQIVSQKGRDVKFAKSVEDGTLTATVPQHREVKTGTLRSVLRQSGIAVEEFEAL